MSRTDLHTAPGTTEVRGPKQTERAELKGAGLREAAGRHRMTTLKSKTCQKVHQAERNASNLGHVSLPWGPES